MVVGMAAAVVTHKPEAVVVILTEVADVAVDVTVALEQPQS